MTELYSKKIEQAFSDDVIDEINKGMTDKIHKTATEHRPQQTIGEYMECYYPGYTVTAPMMSILATRLAMQGKGMKGKPPPRKGSD